jgi:hypothetical protein
MPRRWQDNLSVDRYTPDELLTADLRRQRLQQEVAQHPLESEIKQYNLYHSMSQDAKARYDLQKEIETDRQRTAFYNGLQELEDGLRQRGYAIGSREHAEAFATYAHEFPLARSSADVQNVLKTHATIADEQAALEQRMRAMSPVPEKIAQRYSGVVGDVVQHEAELAGDIARQRQKNIEAKKEGVDYNPSFDVTAAQIAGKLAGARAEKASFERVYPQLAQPTPSEITAPAQAAAVAPAETPAPAATPETRTVGGKTYQWNGTQWEPQ